MRWVCHTRPATDAENTTFAGCIAKLTSLHCPRGPYKTSPTRVMCGLELRYQEQIALDRQYRAQPDFSVPGPAGKFPTIYRGWPLA